jgi:hypothetical protein
MVKWKSEQIGKDKSVRQAEGALPFFPFHYFTIFPFCTLTLTEEETDADL